MDKEIQSQLYDPKTRRPRAPNAWTAAMIAAIRKSSDVEDPAGIVRGIWNGLSNRKKAQIIAQEARGHKFKYNLPLPEDHATRGPGIVRIVRPFDLVEVQKTVSPGLFAKLRKSGLFQVMKSRKYGDRLVRRCKSKKGNLNIFIDR